MSAGVNEEKEVEVRRGARAACFLAVATFGLLPLLVLYVIACRYGPPEATLLVGGTLALLTVAWLQDYDDFYRRTT